MLGIMMQTGMHNLAHVSPFGVHLLVSSPTISVCTHKHALYTNLGCKLDAKCKSRDVLGELCHMQCSFGLERAVMHLQRIVACSNLRKHDAWQKAHQEAQSMHTCHTGVRHVCVCVS